MEPEGFDASNRHGEFRGIHREFQQGACGDEWNVRLKFVEVAKRSDGFGAFLDFIKKKQSTGGKRKADEGQLAEDVGRVGSGEGGFGAGMEFKIYFDQRNFFDSGEFANEPCFAHLARSV